MIEALLAIAVLLLIFYVYSSNNASFDMPTVTFYYTTWCPWCKRMNPIWADAKKELSPYIVFLESDETKVQTRGIESYPSIVLQKQGRLYKFENKYDAAELKKWIMGNLAL
jgi:thioredoxin 2